MERQSLCGFATITGVSTALIGELGDPEGATNIGTLIPIFMMVLMAKGFIMATPFIVRAISGNIMMPALSGGLAGSYGFARASMGSQSWQDIARGRPRCAINTLFRHKRDVDANDGGVTIEVMGHAIDAHKATTARCRCCRAQVSGPAASYVD